jgi:sugar fermentation stimulation protein A
VKLKGKLPAAKSLDRLNRFIVSISLDERSTLAHLANSGRLREILLPGVELLVRRAPDGSRKTQFDVVLARLNSGGLVSVDARLPTPLLQEALGQGGAAGLEGYRVKKREPTLGKGRFDLLLEKGEKLLIAETKSVTLVNKGVALLPDAPTRRGVRHLEEGTRSVVSGLAAAIVFVVQREDARAFTPNVTADPAFASALRTAAEAGVRILAYRCIVSDEEVRIDCRLPIRLR